MEDRSLHSPSVSTTEKIFYLITSLHNAQHGTNYYLGYMLGGGGGVRQYDHRLVADFDCLGLILGGDFVAQYSFTTFLEAISKQKLLVYCTRCGRKESLR